MSDDAVRRDEEVVGAPVAFLARVRIPVSPEVLDANNSLPGLTIGGVGVPWLAAWDMITERHRGRKHGGIPYPHMERWLR